MKERYRACVSACSNAVEILAMIEATFAANEDEDVRCRFSCVS